METANERNVLIMGGGMNWKGNSRDLHSVGERRRARARGARGGSGKGQQGSLKNHQPKSSLNRVPQCQLCAAKCTKG